MKEQRTLRFIGPSDGLVKPTDDSAAAASLVTRIVSIATSHPAAFRGDILAEVTAGEEAGSAIVSKETEGISE